MTPSEIISTSIAAIALIVAWLARLDSKKSVEAAQKSVAAAQRMNDLTARQLELAADQHKRQIEKEIADSRPSFNWACGGSTSPMDGVSEREFINLGEDVTDLTVLTTTPEVSATLLSPKGLLRRNGTGRIKFQNKPGQLTRPIVFTIGCATKLEAHWEKTFKIINEREMDVVEA